MSEILSFLNRVLPSDGYRCGVGITNGLTVPKFFENNEELAKYLALTDSQGTDAYFACSTYLTTDNRKQVNVKYAKALWADIDVGAGKPYPDFDAGELALWDFVDRASMPEPLVVCSGYGVHAYFLLEEELPAAEWKALALDFKSFMESYGLFIDTKVTTDEARILRAPGTHNYKKKEEPKNVYIVNDGVFTPRSFFVDKFKPVRVSTDNIRDVGSAILGGLNDRQYPPSSAAVAVAKCKQLQHFRETGCSASEPTWSACLGVLAHCTDGEELSHEWSSRDARYSHAETARKFERLKQFGPTTCAEFQRRNPDGCKGCKYNVTSPINLGRTEATIEVPFIGAEKLPELPPGYKYGNNNSILVKVKSETEEEGSWKILSDHPFYVEAISRLESEGSLGKLCVRFKFMVPFIGWKTFIMGRGELDGMTARSTLSEMGIDCPYGMERHLMACIRAMMNMRKNMEVETTAYASFGWKDDMKGFVLGHKYYAADGTREVHGTSSFEEKAYNLVPKPGASLDKWRITANKLFTKGCEFQGFTMVASLGTPLLRLLFPDNEGGCIISLLSYGSGQGKSTAIAAAETAWGKAKCLMVQEEASLAAKFKNIGVYCHLPVITDEWADKDPKEIAKEIKVMTQGMEKDRLTQTAHATKEKLTWQTLRIGSTNNAVVDMLVEAGKAPQAARVFEVRCELPSHLNKEVTAKIIDDFHANAGVAGPVFLLHLLKNYNMVDLKQEMMDVTNAIARHIGANTEERYQCRLLAMVFTTAKILSKPIVGNDPFLSCTPTDLVHWGVARILEARESKFKQKDPADQLLSFILQNQHNILSVPHPANPKLPYADSMVKKAKFATIGRYERSTYKLYIPRDLLKKHAVAVGMPFADLMNGLTKLGVVLSINRRTSLLAGTDESPVIVPCWEIDMNHPAMKDGTELLNEDVEKPMNEE